MKESMWVYVKKRMIRTALSLNILWKWGWTWSKSVHQINTYKRACISL